VQRFWYLENECGNYHDIILNIDSTLSSQAQSAANAVASGGAPVGTVQTLDGALFYVDPGGAGQYYTKHAMYTAPESNYRNPLGYVTETDNKGNPVCAVSCSFTNDLMNALLYHYCSWDGTTMPTQPGTQPGSIGCGVAVDTNGISWRVVQLGP
jgi:hypothetical protein